MHVRRTAQSSRDSLRPQMQTQAVVPIHDNAGPIDSIRSARHSQLTRIRGSGTCAADARGCAVHFVANSGSVQLALRIAILDVYGIEVPSLKCLTPIIDESEGLMFTPDEHPGPLTNVEARLDARVKVAVDMANKMFQISLEERLQEERQRGDAKVEEERQHADAKLEEGRQRIVDSIRIRVLLDHGRRIILQIVDPDRAANPDLAATWEGFRNGRSHRALAADLQAPMAGVLDSETVDLICGVNDTHRQLREHGNAAAHCSEAQARTAVEALNQAKLRHCFEQILTISIANDYFQ
ncbi:hypothetical protein DFH07DRAFT_1021030 [Mycena maculata]|uniref:Uncharacterized protein n=1 Tax=Mycena maculata TaxID=230809 RepID=A0AAD7NHF9_9AGAR|nr:hypothetical protein DFH07DRAFT_1021030 [Mycena maculata]